MAKAFKGVKTVGGVSADCVNNVCTPFCLNPEHQYSGPEKLVCRRKGKKTSIVPGKATLVCAEPKDTKCGNLAPKYKFAPGHTGSIECKQVKATQVCKVTCSESELSPSLPQILCKPGKRGRSMFVPAKAAPITCRVPPPTPCGPFKPKFQFAKGTKGTISTECT